MYTDRDQRPPQDLYAKKDGSETWLSVNDFKRRMPERKPWACVILDEAHRSRNLESITSRALWLLCCHGKRTVCMTGTPFNNKVTDVGSLAILVGDAPYDDPEFWKKNPSNQSLIRWRSDYLVLRDKESVTNPELPALTFKEKQFRLSSDEDEVYGACIEYLGKALENYTKVAGSGNQEKRMKALALLLVAFVRLRQSVNHAGLCLKYFDTVDDLVNFDPDQDSPDSLGVQDGDLMEAALRETPIEVPRHVETNLKSKGIYSSKMKALREHLLSDDCKGHKIVVFSQWTSFMNLVEQMFKDTSIVQFRLDGSMSQQKRSRAIQGFTDHSQDPQERPTVFLVSLMAGGVGLNLVSADRVVFCDRWFNPFAEMQAMDRVHRIGQSNPVEVTFINGTSTTDEALGHFQKTKLEKATTTLQGVGRVTLQTSNGLGMEDVAKIFRLTMKLHSTRHSRVLLPPDNSVFYEEFPYKPREQRYKPLLSGNEGTCATLPSAAHSKKKKQSWGGGKRHAALEFRGVSKSRQSGSGQTAHPPFGFGGVSKSATAHPPFGFGGVSKSAAAHPPFGFGGVPKSRQFGGGQTSRPSGDQSLDFDMSEKRITEIKQDLQNFLKNHSATKTDADPKTVRDIVLYLGSGAHNGSLFTKMYGDLKKKTLENSLYSGLLKMGGVNAKTFVDMIRTSNGLNKPNLTIFVPPRSGPPRPGPPPSGRPTSASLGGVLDTMPPKGMPRTGPSLSMVPPSSGALRNVLEEKLEKITKIISDKNQNITDTPLSRQSLDVLARFVASSVPHGAEKTVRQAGASLITKVGSQGFRNALNGHVLFRIDDAKKFLGRHFEIEKKRARESGNFTQASPVSFREQCVLKSIGDFKDYAFGWRWAKYDLEDCSLRDDIMRALRTHRRGMQKRLDILSDNVPLYVG